MEVLKIRSSSSAEAWKALSIFERAMMRAAVLALTGLAVSQRCCHARAPVVAHVRAAEGGRGLLRGCGLNRRAVPGTRGKSAKSAALRRAVIR